MCSDLPNLCVPIFSVQIVQWAEEQEVYVLVDMHQDIYSRYIFGDTAHQHPPLLVAADGQDGMLHCTHPCIDLASFTRIAFVCSNAQVPRNGLR